MANSTARQMPM